MYVWIYAFLSSVVQTWMYQSDYNVLLFSENQCLNLQYSSVSIYYTFILYNYSWRNQIHVCLNESLLQSRGLKPVRPYPIRTIIKI